MLVYLGRQNCLMRFRVALSTYFLLTYSDGKGKISIIYKLLTFLLVFCFSRIFSTQNGNQVYKTFDICRSGNGNFIFYEKYLHFVESSLQG